MEGEPANRAFHRVLLKLSGQALGSETRAIDPATTKSIAGTLKVARASSGSLRCSTADSVTTAPKCTVLRSRAGSS